MNTLRCKSEGNPQAVCDCCPKGKYVATECNSSVKTKCDDCRHEFYTDEINYTKHCLSCRVCHSTSNQRVLTECKASSNRQCECVPGFYCVNEGCDHCLPVESCPPGQGVLNKATRRNNTACAPCQHGTYSNVTDALTQCQPHTRCEAIGRQEKIAGTDKADAVCGDLISGCPWILPASLWAGIVVTLLIFILIGIYWRAKRQSYMPANSSETVVPVNTAFPPFPLVELRYPTECLSQYQERQDEKVPELHFLDKDVFQVNNCKSQSLIETDGTSISITPSEPFSQPGRSTLEHNEMNIGLISNQSEPQEDEWPGT